MAEGKRYYWLRLKDDFFNSKRIKKLRNMAGGDTYTIIYLKMQLLAMKTDGIIRWTGLEESFADELALDLDEKPDDVSVTLLYLLQTGLAETQDNISFFFPYAVENTGSEGASAQRVREFRDRQALQCNAELLQSNACVTPVKQMCNGEKEIDIEKDTDIEKKKSVDGGKKPPAHARGEYGWVKLTNEQYGKLLADLGEEELSRCIRYIDEAAQQTGNKNKWKDWNLIIRKCSRDGWGKGTSRQPATTQKKYVTAEEYKANPPKPNMTLDDLRRAIDSI